MRGDLIPSLANIQLDHSVGVEWIPLVWVDNHTEKTRVSLKEDKIIYVMKN